MHRRALALILALAAGPAVADSHDDTTVSHGISAFGALDYPAGFPHFNYVNPDAPKGGEISFRGTGASATFDSLNWFILRGEPAQGLGRLYDTLMVRAYDEPDALYGLLAESVEYPADRSWAIFTLRPEARFHDGVPVTAEDVAWTLETVRDKGSPMFRLPLSDVAGVEVLDPLRVKVTFAEGVPTRDLAATVAVQPILPKHHYATVDFEAPTLDAPLGSGPYVVDDLEPGRFIRYCRAPDYWAADLPVNVGADNFDCIRYEYFADTTAAFEAFKAGEYLLQEENSSAIWATGYDFPALNRGWVVKDEIADERPSGAQGFWLNMRRPQLQDPRVREAIGKMFNFEWSNATLFYGLYERTDSFWENSNLQATGLPGGAELALLEEFRDRLPARVFDAPAFTPDVSSTAKIDRGAVRAAGALLDEAGWEVGDDGLRRNAAGAVLRIEFVNDSPAFERIILPFIENLQRVGIDAALIGVDPAQMQQRQKEFDYDIVVARFVLPLSPSVELRTLFGSQSADQQGSFNLAGISDPVVDALIERVIGAGTREEMTTAAHALDRVMRSMHVWVPNWYKGTHWLAYWDVFGRPETKPPYDRGVDFWWFDQAKFDTLRAAGALD